MEAQGAACRGSLASLVIAMQTIPSPEASCDGGRIAASAVPGIRDAPRRASEVGEQTACLLGNFVLTRQRKNSLCLLATTRGQVRTHGALGMIGILVLFA